jgi:hypothetical protein
MSLAKQSEHDFLSEDEEQQIKDKLKGWGTCKQWSQKQQCIRPTAPFRTAEH